MSQELTVQHMAVETLAQRCAEETDLFFRRLDHNTQYCFELFRRALQRKTEESEIAWGYIVERYSGMVTGWVIQHYSFSATGADADDFVSQAFARIWHTITAEKFGKFSDLPAILRYLKMCVHSLIIDSTRRGDMHNLSAWEATSKREASGDPSPEEQAMDQLEGRRLWELLKERLNDEKEWRVMECSFVLDMKPQEILDKYRGQFSDIDEIYRVKQNVIVRLRRDAEFRKLLGLDD